MTGCKNSGFFGGSSVVPVEVKAEVNLQAKSLRVFWEQYKLELSVRTAMTDYRRQDWLVNVPLWEIGAVDRLFSS